MELRKVLKSIVALGTGATLVGATVLSALAAADLANYPAPFVEDGAFNALIVVGENAATADVLGSIDIATSLQAANTVTKTVPGTSETVTVEGDAFRLDSGSDFLEMGEYVDEVGITTLTDNELAALAGGTVTNSKGTSDYDESLSVADNATVVYEVDPDDTTDIPGWYLKFWNGDVVYTYKTTFTPGFESDIEAGGVLDDYEDRSISLLGKEYTIINADLNGKNSWTLDLMSGAVRDVINIGETKTYSIGDNDYEVTLTYVDDSNGAKFTINGASTNILASGETEVLADGTEMGVSEVLYQAYAGGVQSSEFYLGATKIRIRDTDTSLDGTGSSLVIGSNTVTDVAGDIRATNTTDEARLNYFEFVWVADEDIYVPVGGKLSDKADDDQMYLNFDIIFEGIEEDSATDTIQFKGRGDDEYDLDFTNKAGNELSIPLWDMDATLRQGNENYDLIAFEDGGNLTHWDATGTAIDTNDYFVVSDSAGKNTYLVRYKNLDAGEEIMEFEEMGSGQTITVSYTFTDMVTEAADLTLGGVDFGIYLAASSNDAQIYVDLDAGADIEVATASPAWFTKYEAEIVVNTTNGVTISTENLDDAAAAEDYIFTADVDTADEIDMQTPTGAISLDTIGDSDNSEGYGIWGTHVFRTNVDSGPDRMTLTYPDDQTEMAVFYSSGETTSTTSAGGSTYEEVVPIDVGAAVLDTEVSDYSAQNHLIVGGPSVNAAAADVLENPDPCTTGFEEGKAMIKLFERTNGNVAILVAGMLAMDTRRASRALANYGTYDLTGMEVEVSGTSLTQITVSTPTTE